MKTIKQSLFNRLIVQAEEAEFQGLTKIAKSLTNQIDLYAGNIRPTEAIYSYSSDVFAEDIKDCLWEMAIRTADFHNVSFDADKIENLIECLPGESEKIILNIEEEND